MGGVDRSGNGGPIRNNSVPDEPNPNLENENETQTPTASASATIGLATINQHASSAQTLIPGRTSFLSANLRNQPELPVAQASTVIPEDATPISAEHVHFAEPDTEENNAFARYQITLERAAIISTYSGRQNAPITITNLPDSDSDSEPDSASNRGVQN